MWGNNNRRYSFLFAVVVSYLNKEVTDLQSGKRLSSYQGQSPSLKFRPSSNMTPFLSNNTITNNNNNNTTNSNREGEESTPFTHHYLTPAMTS